MTKKDIGSVSGEATRLTARIIRNSRQDESTTVRNVIGAGGLPYLVEMVKSDHLVMQNEALVALLLVASTALGEYGCHGWGGYRRLGGG